MMLRSAIFFLPSPSSSPCFPSLPPKSLIISPRVRLSLRSFCHQRRWQARKKPPFSLCRSTQTDAAFPFPSFQHRQPPEAEDDKWDSSKYEALLRGGDQVTSVLQDMVNLLADMDMDEASERVAVEIAAQGVIGKRVDEMESGFMMAIDYMIQMAEKDNDDQRKSLLEVVKQTVLDHLAKKCPPHVQVIGLLCRTPDKESRHELLRRVAAGGGVFKSEKGLKVHLPGANLNDIANQADDLLEVNFLSKLVSLRPGSTVQKMISDVMHGKNEGADNVDSGDEDPNSEQNILGGFAGRGSVTGRRPRPVRPGMFLETVSKVLGGIYSGNVSGITAQHLEWVHQKTLQILQEMAF
ncbi:protein PEP-RELATED DEVELOPMENT ARRESTED 1, chloroplastic-like isoform X2 [Musa acuminata AAA Group]|uniref:protein PEP-RELATED DEVELOPMENT ARRESTED 1, chloroplastic-like isoform X2 n=1 Tax=Musa acuminata AAA Group TaxID=214697 RepID=UPI0031D9AABC